MAKPRRGKIEVEIFAEDEVDEELDEKELTALEGFEEESKQQLKVKSEMEEKDMAERKRTTPSPKVVVEEELEEEELDEEEDEDDEDDEELAPDLGFAPFIYNGNDTTWELYDLFEQVRDGNKKVVIYDVTEENRGPVWFTLVEAKVDISE